jgi:2-keto-4-pentenoate hydratase/2-oxohepta-3-ene-1,7-dioic acid hydratase in catechol pathway
MRLARVHTPDGPRSVVQDGDRWSVIKDLFADPVTRTGETYPVDSTALHAPTEPRVVLGMAHNSGPADRELPPQAFMKSARTTVGPGDPIHIDSRFGQVVVEGELAVVIGRTSRNLAPGDVPGAILGWTIGNDVTAVEQIPLDEKMTQSKNGNGFTPIGPWIETDLDPADLAIEVSVGGDVAARSTTAHLAWDIAEQLVYLTSFLTLGPGDIVLTGSPWTAAPVVPGDVASITIAGLGTLTNPVVSWPAGPTRVRGSQSQGVARLSTQIMM